ncbi:MAG: hypothetical protein ACF8OB_13955 [Phycisphaeraceae bacterium JB051]
MNQKRVVRGIFTLSLLLAMLLTTAVGAQPTNSDAQEKPAASSSTHESAGSSTNPATQTQPPYQTGQPTAGVNDPFSMPINDVTPTRFIPAPEGSPFPKITLRGIVITKDQTQSPIALIEVAQYGTYVVRTEDTISLQKITRGKPDDKSVIRIVAISRTDVTVQMGSLGEKLIVR